MGRNFNQIPYYNKIIQQRSNPKSFNNIILQIEQIKIQLCSNETFIPTKLFTTLTKNTKQFISLQDLISYLQENNVSYNEKSLRRFIHNYNKDNNFLLNYKEFKNIVLPFTDNDLRNETEQRKCKTNNNI